MRGKFELDGDSDEALRERVVDLAGHAVALGEDCVELRAEAADAKSIEKDDDGGNQRKSEEKEPRLAIERRANVKGEFRSCFVPCAIVICGLHAEAIMARRQVGVVGDAA